ncbi:MAG TPA: APC family permease, partial [Oligoflexia bacterium]|nr:APC family permease [Oligoflexia bacterium]
GNDITSSVLYVSALTIGVAGIYAPIGLLLVSLVLYGFRKVYGEVGAALPLNGGAYTVLLNTTNKKVAAGAATLTIISYLATAVISATEAMHYLHSILPSIDPAPATVALLGAFALLSIVGITESSKVAVVIFIVHIVSLTMLVLTCVALVFTDGFAFSLDRMFESGRQVSPLTGIFVGFCAGMLGISGFESSANFIEEQKPGVFPKTLRNMWAAITVFNPLICVLTLLVIGAASTQEYENSLLSELARRSGGPWLQRLIGIDAFLVLSGAVLTSYVGVIGLVRRMTLDRCLPQFFLKENKWRNTNHWIILGFFLLSCAILVLTGGKVSALAGVYALSFLSVMALFALGNLFLKKTRARLPRSEEAKLSVVAVCLFAVLVAGVYHVTVENIRSLLVFVTILGGAVAIMFSRILILRLGLFSLKSVVDSFAGASHHFQKFLYNAIENANSQAVIYFSRGDDLKILNHAALYVLRNEQTNNLIVINVYRNENEIPPNLANQLRVIDQLYPEIRIDFLAVQGAFGPQVVEKLSKRLGIPKNCMFIGTPGTNFKHSLAELGGVRIIL